MKTPKIQHETRELNDDTSAKHPVYPNVPKLFDGRFPDGYRPWTDAWSVQLDDLKTLPDGTYNMTQLDISICNDEFVRRVNEGFTVCQKLTELDIRTLSRRKKKFACLECTIGCQHCFVGADITRPLMTTEEVFHLLKEAQELGVRQVKFLGPGELLNNPRLFEILDFLLEHDIKIGIFTKGVVLGDDERAQKIFGMTAHELCKRIIAYPNVAILFGLTSTDRETEMARINSKTTPNFFELRNKAFENLVNLGLNQNLIRQRLALICAPVLNDNIDEVLDLFRWGLERNIPVIAAPTMLSGRGKNMPEVHDDVFKEEKLVQLYAAIYFELVRQKIMTRAQIEIEGIAPYPGYACSQFISGLYVGPDGVARGCPGVPDDSKKPSPIFTYCPDVRQQPLKNIWKNCLGYKLRDQLVRTHKLQLTQPCYAKTEGIVMPDGEIPIQRDCGSFPERFGEMVLEILQARVNALGTEA